MTDLLLYVTETGADLRIVEGELVADEGLETAIIVSLFSDARADPEERLPEEIGTDDPPFIREIRGFWADTVLDRWGSKLYLLSRAKATDETATRASRFVEQALAWLVSSQIATAVTVSADFEELRTDAGRLEKVLSLEIGISRGTSSRWDTLWSSIESSTFEAAGVRIRLLAA